MVFKFVNSFVGIQRPLPPFEKKGLRNYTHGQYPHFPGDTGDYGRSAGPRSSSHARGNEDHVGSVDKSCKHVPAFKRSFASDYRIGTGPQSPCKVCSYLYPCRRKRGFKVLYVGIHRDELHAVYMGGYHTVDGIAATASHSDHLDLRRRSSYIFYFKHGDLLSFVTHNILKKTGHFIKQSCAVCILRLV